MAMNAMPIPATMPTPKSPSERPMYTCWPRPLVPTRAAMTSIAMPNMIVWLRPSIMTGIAIGSFTRHRSCRRVHPKQVAASTTSAGTFRSPCSAYRIAGTIA